MIYAINADTFGISEYQEGMALSLATSGSKTVLARTTGLDELTGTSDNGTDIDAYVTTGKMMAGDRSAQKEVHHLWLGLAGSDDVEVTLYPSWWRGQDTLGPYLAEPAELQTTDEPYGRVVRGLLGEAGQWWKVKVGNKDGGEFDLRSLVLTLDQTRIVQ